MKKLIPFLALAVLISSCGNKMTLLKRHYTKGYYVQNSRHVDKMLVANANKTSMDKMSPLAVRFTEQKTGTEVIACLKHTICDKAASKGYQVRSQKDLASEKTAIHNSSPISIKQPQSFVGESKDQKKGGSSEGNLILLVILAIFPILSLVAMYIHDGHKVTTNFWVNLLLHLTVIGYAIFGLLVVFNVVDLA